VDPDETEREWALGPADMDVCIDGPAVEDEALLLEQGLEGRTGDELRGHLPACAIVHWGLPVVFSADHEAHLMGFARPEALDTGVTKIGPEPATPPGRIDGERPAVMLPGGTASVYLREACDGAH
jgi:hypothetical protein